MILALCLLGVFQQSPSEEHVFDEVQDALEEGAYGAAWELANSVRSTTIRSRACALIMSRAGNLAGALEAAVEGLRESPEHLDLLFHATASAVAIGEVSEARAHFDGLAAAVQNAELADTHRPAWERVVTGFESRVQDLERLERDRDAALRAARVSSLLLLGLIGLAILLLQPSGAADRNPGDPCG